ncbi:amidohydrolase family protein [Siccirubricoccus deserti]
MIRPKAISASSTATSTPLPQPGGFRPLPVGALAGAPPQHRPSVPSGVGAHLLYPRMSPGNGMRGDAWPKDGSPPGSDLELMREQLLDLFDVRYGLLAPLVGGAAAERNVEFGAAMAVAVNEWQCATCDPEPRLKASVQITLEHEESALAEIEQRAGDARFAQVNIPPRGLEPLGRHRYRKILAASAAAGFPISLHLGGTSGHASTGGGWPSFYHEEHPPTSRACRPWSPAWSAKVSSRRSPTSRSCWWKAASPGCRRWPGGSTSTGSGCAPRCRS